MKVLKKEHIFEKNLRVVQSIILKKKLNWFWTLETVMEKQARYKQKI